MTLSAEGKKSYRIELVIEPCVPSHLQRLKDILRLVSTLRILKYIEEFLVYRNRIRRVQRNKGNGNSRMKDLRNKQN